MKAFAKAGLVAWLLWSAVAEAKPLYVTVPRTYATAESPVIEVSYSTAEPVELRVLRPQSLDTFVQAHRNVRRAYEQPPVLVNPGHFLARGLNQIRNPSDALRRMMNQQTRLKVTRSLEDAVEGVGDSSLVILDPGPDKLAGTPPGMTVLKREWLNLDLGGAERDFTVPGYETYGNSGYQDRSVTLMPLPPGIYVVQLVQGLIEAQVTLVVSNLVAQVKQSSDSVLVRVATRKGAPSTKTAIDVYDGKAKLGSLTTDDNGEARMSLQNNSKLVVVAKRADDATLVDTDHYGSVTATPGVFIYSDRPLYRPGETVRYRGVVRKTSGFWQTLFSPKTSHVKVALEPGGTVTDVTIDEFGTFSGELVVPRDAADMVRVVATLDKVAKEPGDEHQSEARVMDYVKPTYFAELKSAVDNVVPGSPLTVDIVAKRYAGGAPKGVRFEYFLYRTKLDTPAWVDDAGLGGRGSAVTYGSASTSEGRLNVPERLASSLESRESYGDDHWSSAPSLDAEGKGSFEVEVPALAAGEEQQNYKYLVEVRLRDASGEEVRTRKHFVLAACDVAAAVRFDRAAYGPEQAITVAVRSSSPVGKAIAAVTGQLKVKLELVDGSSSVVLDQSVTTDDLGVARIPVKATGPGRLVAEVVLSDSKGRKDASSHTALLLGRGAEAVQDVPTLTATALYDIVEPDAEATVVAMFPAAWAKGASGNVWITLSGLDVYESTRLVLTGHTLSYKFDAERRYGSSVYAEIAYVGADGRFEERAVPVRIVTSERLLQVELEPQKLEGAPATEQVVRVATHDSRGAAVSASVSVSVVDKAVYAIAPEFRPRIEAFFYPPPRLAVSTFQSADFQGYGYGEMLARLRRAKRFDFADIKSPSNIVEAREDDTIYWNASVVTDATGFAEVRFKTPQKPAMFVITAVAADKSGRFGEQRSEFATRAGSTLSVFAPAFLRQGDQATAQVRMTSQKADKGTLALTQDGALKANQAQSEQVLGAADEKVVQVALNAERLGAASLAMTWSGANKNKDVRRVDVISAEQSSLEVVSATGGGELAFVGTPQSAVTVEVLPSLSAMVLAEARQLLEYPYGCLEQLIATTVPNMALTEFLSARQAARLLDAADERLLAEARSRTTAGITRILRLQQASGGFTWFDGYSTPSLPMTLVALEGLSYAQKAGHLTTAQVAPSLAWVTAQTDLPITLDAMRAYVLARFSGEAAAPRIRQVIARNEPNLVALAYLRLAALEAGVAKELAPTFVALADAAKDRAAIRSAAYSASYYTLPMGELGAAALISHAVTAGSEGQSEDAATARALFAEALARPQSTLSMSALLLHSAHLLKADEKALTAQKAPVLTTSNGEVTMTKRPFGFTATLPVGAQKIKAPSVDGTVVMRALTTGRKAPTGGLAVSRKYYKLAGAQRKELAASDVLQVGDEVFVELTLDTLDDVPAASAYTVLVDPLPAGFNVLREDRAYEGAPFTLPLRHEAMRKREFARDHVTYFFESPSRWSKAPRVLGYVMRADFAGQFKAPSATLTDMYDAARSAASEPAVLTVR